MTGALILRSARISISRKDRARAEEEQVRINKFEDRQQLELSSHEKEIGFVCKMCTEKIFRVSDEDVEDHFDETEHTSFKKMTRREYERRYDEANRKND